MKMPATPGTCSWKAPQAFRTRIQLHRIEEAGDATNPAVIGPELFALVTPPGASLAERQGLFLTAGTWMVGLSASSGQGPYRIRFEPAATPPAAAAANTTPEQAAPVAGEFSAPGTFVGTEAWYSWRLSGLDARKRWKLSAAAPLGGKVELELQTADGKSLYSTSRFVGGALELPDIGLPEGTYRIRLKNAETSPRPIALSTKSDGPRSPGREDEPNDALAAARPIALARPVTGRISQDGDADYYALPTHASLAGSKIDIAVDGDSKKAVKLCLGDAQGNALQCREAVRPRLSDIVLQGDPSLVILSGTQDPASTYQLTVRLAGPAEPTVESEPNDNAQQATEISAAGMRGRFIGRETDMFRLKVEKPSLHWRAVAEGKLEGFELHDQHGQVVAKGILAKSDPANPTLETVIIEDIQLGAGDYWLALTGTDADYKLSLSSSAVASAAPNDGEPNDKIENAALLEIGEKREGAFKAPDDIDFFRFSARAQEQVAIKIDAPSSACMTEFYLTWDVQGVTFPRAEFSGTSFRYDALVEPGDYFIQLRCTCAEDSKYTISIEREPVAKSAGDIEPNDSFNTGRPVPGTLTVSGKVGQFTDDDWYRLAAFQTETKVKIKVQGSVTVNITDGKPSDAAYIPTPTVIASVQGPGEVEAAIPAGIEAAIGVTGQGDYSLEFAIDGLQPSAAGTSAASTVSASLDFPQSEVAAYWHKSQRLEGSVTLENSGEAAATVTLDAISSDSAWHPALGRDPIVVPPKAKADSPIAIEIDPDTSGAAEIAVSVMQDGKSVGSGAKTLSAIPLAQPVGVHQSFAPPAQLRGGFNVAWAAFGAIVSQTGTVEGLEAVNDGLGSTVGFTVDGSGAPFVFTIEFGGGKLWPVTGVAVNPQVPSARPTEWLKDFELLLSRDGTNFEPVLSGTLSPAPREQMFVLPKPYEAMAAQIRMKSNHQGNIGRITLSEVKIIANSAALQQMSLDLADPSRGGHVVWARPLISDQPLVERGMLEAGGHGLSVKPVAGERPAFVIGFHENRAAQIGSVEWIDAEDAAKSPLLASVSVEASTHSPLGPWTPIGELNPAVSAGGMSELKFNSPVWARFLRFSGPAATTPDRVRYPTQIRVIERPTDTEYRSILGEWGHFSSDGIYEQLVPQEVQSRPEADANETRDTAEAIALDQTVTGKVEIGKDEDWYKFVAPAGLDRALFVLRGDPSVDADLVLEDQAGKPVPLQLISSAPTEARLEARLQPGQPYFARVVQPPHSIMIAYDLSGSIQSFKPLIHAGLKVFARGVTPGQEAVNFLPFDGQPKLKDFTDQRQLLQQALEGAELENTTSGLETTMLTAARALAGRRGKRAILVLTDASSPMTATQPEMWSLLEQVRPTIFAAHIGSFDNPLREKQILQDMAMASGGHYTSARTQAAMDVVFERVATWLRRPAYYKLSVEAPKAEPAPAAPKKDEAPAEPKTAEAPAEELGTLKVVEAEPNIQIDRESYDHPEKRLGAIEIVLDASGSMLKRMGDQRRIEIARSSLTKLVTEELPAAAPVALRVFGHDKPGSCETALVQPIAPLDPAAMTGIVSGIHPQNLARTPIGASLRAVREDLAGVEGRATVILLTDGEETCEGDPRGEIAALAADKIEVRVNIVGFAVDDPNLKEEFKEWARLGRGTYFDAAEPEALPKAVKAATRLTFRAIDQSGTIAGTGAVDGDALALKPGAYRVEIDSAPPTKFENIIVTANEVTKIEHRNTVVK